MNNSSDRPNILFLFSDQHRGDWMPYDDGVKSKMGVAGLDLHMPVIRSMMERGTSFHCAVSPAPICAPARACLASGRRYKNCRVYANNANYDSALPTFYAGLRNAGYHICGTGKFDLNKADLYWGDGYHKVLQEIGFDEALDSEGKMDTVWAAMKGEPGPYGQMLQDAGWLERHMEDMIKRGGSAVPTPLPDEYYADNWVAEKTKAMIRDLPEDQPWFMQVNFSGPHDPWDITEKMKSAMAERSFPQAADCDHVDENAEVRKNYAAMIENIDRLCGEIIETVRQRGDLDNTILVYSSDHGEMMGDHSKYGKAKPEQGSVHIPMLIDASRLDGKQGISCGTPVELQDLAATFLDYAGAESLSGAESKSLRPIVEGETDRVRDYAISELINPNPRGLIGTFGTITDGRWKLIMRLGEKDRLYDLEHDPFECDNLSEQHPEEVQRLKQAFGDREIRRNPAIEAYAKAFSLRG